MNTKTYKVTRTLRSYLEKTVTVPDGWLEEDVIEEAWNDDGPWVPAGSRDMGTECEEQ